MRSVLFLLALAAAPASADNPLTPFPSPMSPPSAAPTSTAGFVSGTCGTTNAIAFFSAASTLTCDADFVWTPSTNTLSFASTTSVSLANAVNALNFDSGTLSIDAANNRIGVGTTTPALDVDVVHNYNGDVEVQLQNTTNGTSATTFYHSQAGATNGYFGSYSAAYTGSGFATFADFVTLEGGLGGSGVGIYDGTGLFKVFHNTGGSQRVDLLVSAAGDTTIGAATTAVTTVTGDLIGSQVAAGTTNSWRIPTGAANAVPAKPACAASTDFGRMVFLDDTNDAAGADACMCGKWADDTTFSWASIMHNDAVTGNPAACSL